MSLVLMAWNIGTGDAVFVPSFTFFATAEVVSLIGATPIFVDVDKRTFNISVSSLREAIDYAIEQKLTPKVIIPVDLFGLSADYNEIQIIAKEYGCLILEDSAQGFGGSIDGKVNCSFGDAATTSFYPAKPLGCYGDGGAIFTHDDELAKILRSLRAHGIGNHRYDNIRIGLNSRLDTLQAAILLVKLKAFREHELQDVNKIAEYYNSSLRKYVKVPFIPDGYISSYAQYTIIFQDSFERDFVMTFLNDLGIPSVIYYPKPLHLQSAFNNLNRQTTVLRNSEELSDQVLSIPIHPYLSFDEADFVANSIIEAIGRYKNNSELK
jgi:dTDP-4-amino-4,6-dideoxygalactose transaminase